MHDGRLQRDLRRAADEPLGELPAVLREAGDVHSAADLRPYIRHRGGRQRDASRRLREAQSYEECA